MQDKTELIKIEKTDANIDNSHIEQKIAEEQTDDYGNTVILYRKHIVDVSALQEEKSNIESRLIEINTLLDEINKLG